MRNAAKSALTLFLCSTLCHASVDVLTAHYTNYREGWNSNEVTLTPTAIQSSYFGKMGAFSVDGPVYAQPLIATGVVLAGGTKDLLIISTMNNTIYAFDSHVPGSAPVWSTNFGSPLASYPSFATNGLLFGGSIGCLSTPVIDKVAGILYSVCSTSAATWVLRSLRLTTGAVLQSVTVTGTVPGTGDRGTTCNGCSVPGVADTISGPNLIFYAAYELQRNALLLANGNVYVSFGSYTDYRPYHGWIMAYNANNFAQVGVFCTSPNLWGAGLWNSSGGLTALPNGNLITATGNGPWDANNDYGESIIELSPSLTLTDWFTPGNWATLNADDSDLASARSMVMPGTNQVVSGGKDFRVYSLNSTSLGHLGSTNNQIFFTNPAQPNIGPASHVGIYDGVLMNGRGYFSNTYGAIYEYTFSGSTWNTSPSAVSATTFNFPGAVMSGSSNGSTNSLLWALSATTDSINIKGPGILYVMDPITMNILYSSANLQKDNLGTFTKFAMPVVANGSVYVATMDNAVAVYGIRTISSSAPSDTKLRGRFVMHGNTRIR